MRHLWRRLVQPRRTLIHTHRVEGDELATFGGSGGGGDDFFSELVGEIQDTFWLPVGFPNLVADELGGHRFSIGVGRGVAEEFLDGDVNLTDLAVFEEAIGNELDLEDEAICIDDGGDGEFQGVVPLGILSAGLVYRGSLSGSEVVAKAGNGVDLHLAEEIDVVEIHGRYDRQIQRPKFHVELVVVERRKIGGGFTRVMS